jgi:hypothetical protein
MFFKKIFALILIAVFSVIGPGFAKAGRCPVNHDTLPWTQSLSFVIEDMVDEMTRRNWTITGIAKDIYACYIVWFEFEGECAAVMVDTNTGQGKLVSCLDGYKTFLKGIAQGDYEKIRGAHDF